MAEHDRRFQSGNFGARSIAWKRGSLRSGSRRVTGLMHPLDALLPREQAKSAFLAH